VDCDVAPMSACHLLLGWPWQLNVDATHGGHSNNYSFVQKGLPYVLKRMEASANKDESFPILSKKKHIPTHIGISDPAIAVSISNDAITTVIDGSKIVY
jgi:hypothetical protein